MKLVFVAVLFTLVGVSSSASIINRLFSSGQDIIDGVQSAMSGLFVRHATFCRDLDCPSYETLATEEKYEIRQYDVTNWASADYSSGSSSTFRKLFKYIQGSNSRDEKIAMTVPVLMKVRSGHNGQADQKMTMSFYLTVANSPTPTDSHVRLNQLGKVTVYVRSFSGFTWRWSSWASQVRELKEALQRDGLGDSYEHEYYTAGYDSPWTLFNRHNEVWFIKKE